MALKKEALTTVALILMLTTMTFVALPIAIAHDPPIEFASYPYVVAAPDPVGVGQTTYISMWVDRVMPASFISNTIRRGNYTLTITAPDDTTALTKHWDIVEDTTGIAFISFTPDQVGEYTLKFDYGGQVYTWGPDEPNIETNQMIGWFYQNDTFLPASTTTTLTVQQEPLPDPITSYPLPTEYWTRPIEGQNTDWWKISSNWLGGSYIKSRTQPDGIAPNSPHIMWTKPLEAGGVVGGSIGTHEGEAFYMGGSYNARFQSTHIIMNGILYYELPKGNADTGGGTIAVDLRTGEEIWYNPLIGAAETENWMRGASGSILPSISFGYYLSVDDRNQHGVTPSGILFSRNFGVGYNPLDGTLMYNVTGVPSGAEVTGQKGEIVRYVWNNNGRYLMKWNFSRIFTYDYRDYEGGHTPAYGRILNATHHLQYDNPDVTYPEYYDGTAFEWNMTISGIGPGRWSIASSRTAGSLADLDNILLLMQGDLGPRKERGWFDIDAYQTALIEGANITAISLKPTSRGQVLWSRHYDAAPGNVERRFLTWDPNVGVFVTIDSETMNMNGFSLDDGRHLWGPIAPESVFAFFNHAGGGGDGGVTAYGNLYYSGYGGVLYCWDMLTGDLEWSYGDGGEGNTTASVQTPWDRRPIFVSTIADGKIYLLSTEHSPNTPLYKDSDVRCVNATTGEEIWTLMGWGTGMTATSASAVADGFLVYLNCYDEQIYCVGKGPSETTVTASPKVLMYGDSVLVEGTVIDIAAGTQQDEQAARFPHGVPAVSDESMSDWMEYVYMQKPRPSTATGVEVALSVLDPNNNYYEIGTVTSDANGMYKMLWEPLVPGEYTVIATFGGSESYWPSYAETAVGVTAAPEATPPPTAPPASAADLYFVPATAGIIVAIAVVGVVLVLMLRKR